MNLENNVDDAYVIDIIENIDLYGVLYRASINYGKITEIKLPDELNGCTIFTAKDLNTNILKINNKEITILAENEITYYGEPILFIVGESIDTVRKVMKKIFISYEIDNGYNPIFLNILGKKTILEKKLKIGKNKTTDVDDEISSVAYTQPQEHFYPDSQGVVVKYINDDSIVVHISTDWPKHVKYSLTSMLNIKNVEVNLTKSSPSYDGKIWQPTALAYLAGTAAKKLKKNIKLSLSKYEDVLFSCKRAPSIFFIKSSYDASNETLNNQSISFRFNCGVFTPFANEIIENVFFAAENFYKKKSLEVLGEVVQSSNVPADLFSGISMPQFFFANEMHINQIARELKVDPLSFRLQNINHDFFSKINNIAEKYKYTLKINDYAKRTHFAKLFGLEKSQNNDIEIKNLKAKYYNFKMDGYTIYDSPFLAILTLLDVFSDFGRKYAAYEIIRCNTKRTVKMIDRKGIGLSTAIQGNNLKIENSVFHNSVKLEYFENDKIKITTSISKIDSQIITKWKTIILDILKIPSDKIEISYSFKNEIDEFITSTISDDLTTITTLIKEGCKQLLEKIEKEGSNKNYCIIKKGEDLYTDENKNLIYSSTTSAGMVVEVSISFITFEIKINKISLIIDAGKVSNEKQLKQKLENSIIQSIIWSTIDQSNNALAKDFIFNFPGISYLPNIEIFFLKSNSQNEKNIKEIVYSLFPAAFASAVAQATNKTINKLPIQADDLKNLYTFEENKNGD